MTISHIVVLLVCLDPSDPRAARAPPPRRRHRRAPASRPARIRDTRPTPPPCSGR